MRLRMSLATELPAIATAASLAVFTAWIWSRAPERLPIHWDMHGTPDGFGSRFAALLVPPAVILALYFVLAFAPTLATQARDARFERAYHLFRHGIVMLLALVHALLALRTIGVRIPDAVALILALLGIVALTLRLVARARARAATRRPPLPPGG